MKKNFTAWLQVQWIKVSLFKIFASRTPFVYSYFKISFKHEIVRWQWLLYGHESFKNWMARDFFSDLLSKSHPWLLANNDEKQVIKLPNQLVYLWAAEDINWGAKDELCSMTMPVWSHWMSYSPDVLIAIFLKHCTWFYLCCFPWHQCKFSRQNTKSHSTKRLMQKLPITLFPNSWQLLQWSLVSTHIGLPDEAVTAFCSSCEMEW